ncbi:MAG: hypothetical protein DYG89_15765 [Caldilinea sp. CFX5]|nr:hypothetical protein [Caldilinea sp. CFX5]
MDRLETYRTLLKELLKQHAEGLATELVERGVPREDVVLAFHPPAMRPYTEFAVS